MVEKDRVFDFLARLNTDLDEVRGRILGREPLPNSREAFAEVRREESRRQVMLGPKGNEPANPVETTAMTSRFQKRGERPICDHCHKPGHVKAKCWKLHGKPEDFQPSHRSARDKAASHATHVFTESAASEQPFFTKENLEQMFNLWNSHQSSSSTTPFSSLAQKDLYISHECQNQRY